MFLLSRQPSLKLSLRRVGVVGIQMANENAKKFSIEGEIEM